MTSPLPELPASKVQEILASRKKNDEEVIARYLAEMLAEPHLHNEEWANRMIQREKDKGTWRG